MPRNEELEALLQAQYDLEGAWPEQKAARHAVFIKLVKHYVRKYNATASARGQREITESEFREAIGERYYQFKKARDRELIRKLTT
ncbi:MAG TPA: hypothetical protein PKA41_10110 [Verrucomicrobiota bacterium]|nr:hypothetical protein [Verrucomicrobiota bacterium]